MIWSAALMLQHLGEQDAATAILTAVENVLGRGKADEVTRDMGGQGSTDALGAAVEQELVALAAKK